MEIKVNNNTHCRQPGLVLPVIVLMLLISSATQAATTFHVTTTADNGDNVNPTSGSLRKAIIDANVSAGADVIDFQIPGSGVQTISPPSPLPTIAESVTIDGYTQPGASARNRRLRSSRGDEKNSSGGAISTISP